MPNGLRKISKFLLRSTPARHNQREPVGQYKKKIKHAKLGNAMLDNQPLNGPLNCVLNSHNELVSQKSRRLKPVGLVQHLTR